MATNVTPLTRDQVKPIPQNAVPLIKRVMHVMTRTHVWIYKKTEGRLGKNFMGSPCCIVRMTGRKSGQIREIPLIYIPDGDDVILIASQAGMEKHPTWYYNLKANGNVEIIADGKTRKMIARQANDEEKAQRWPRAVEVYSDFNEYQARTDRDIPLFICEPA